MLDKVAGLLRSGWKTTEFWLTLLFLGTPELLNLSAADVSKWAAAHGYPSAIVLAAYIIARAVVKRKAADALTTVDVAREVGAHVAAATLDTAAATTVTP